MTQDESDGLERILMVGVSLTLGLVSVELLRLAVASAARSGASLPEWLPRVAGSIMPTLPRGPRGEA